MLSCAQFRLATFSKETRTISPWPRPEGLLPPRLIEALGEALRGDFERASKGCADADPRDALSGGVVRLVSGLEALAQGRADKARPLLSPLARGREPALVLLATLALVEHHLERRSFARAVPLLRRARRRMREPAEELFVDAALLHVELLRRGSAPAERLGELAARLERRHPAAVHAAIHVLCAEAALLAGDHVASVLAQREARPYVQAAGHASLARRHEAVTHLLRAPFAEAEDWEQPLRPLSREELSEIEGRGWQVWVDALHRRARVRQKPRDAVQATSFARAPQAWDALLALLGTPRHEISWAQAAALHVGVDEAGVRQAAQRLAKLLGGDEGPIAVRAQGYALCAERFVFVFPTGRLRAPEQRLLALLAEQPGARAVELATSSGLAHRTVARHLASLRGAGFVHLVGGGPEARYRLV